MTEYLLVLLSKQSKAQQSALYAVLSENGITRENSDVLYVLGDEQPENAKGQPSAAQLTRCVPAFRDALMRATPACIITFGGLPTYYVTGRRWKVENCRGYIFLPADCAPIEMKVQMPEGTYKTGPRKGQPKYVSRLVNLPPPFPESWSEGPDPAHPHAHFIVPCLDYTYVRKLRMRPISAFSAAISNAVEYRRGAPLETLTSWTEYVGGLEVPEGGGALAFDLEAPIGSTSIEQFSLSWSAPSGNRTATLPWGRETADFMRKALEAPGFVRIAHNIAYDAPLLAKNGITVPEPWWDTMIAGSFVEPDLPKSLEANIPLYMLTRPHKHLADERGYNDPEYSAKDAWTERRLYEEQWRTLEEWGSLGFFSGRIMPSVWSLVRLRDRGIAVNSERARVWCGKLRADLHELAQWWSSYAPGVDAGSPAQVAKYLYKDLGLPVQRNDEDGVSVDALAILTLREIAPEHAEPLTKLLAIRAVSKLLGTYGKTLETRFRVHPSYLPAGRFERPGDREKSKYLPGTGRLASSSPNIQNQPPESRVIFEPDYPDWVFVAADYSQAELWVMAARSGDRALLEALRSGDIHSRTMERIGCDRTLAKNGLYGTSYGAGARKLVRVMALNGVRVTEAEMKDFQTSLSRAYPDWWAYLMELGRLAAEQGYLRNCFGRVRRFPDTGRDTPAARDYDPQSTVGDIGWSTYRALDDGAESIGCRLTALIHDEVLVQGPREKAREMMSMLKDVMGQEFPEVAPGFRIPVNCKVGPLWGPDMVKEARWTF